MFSSLRGRFGIPGVISVVALVFAMIGGAYAASDNSGFGHKASASAAKKGLPGPRGKRGKPGPAGPVGPAGPAGSAGAKGDTGGEGQQGLRGERGSRGREGEPGEEGDPWTAGGTLPEGATETGSWATTTATELEPGFFGGMAAVSFPIQLKAGFEGLNNVIVVGKGSPVPEQCDDGDETVASSPEHPEAKSGFLCIFVAHATASSPFPFVSTQKPAVGEGGTSTAGAILQVVGPNANEGVWGTFAVTG
jgi:Collagen triple helix repeat (20 copies)